MWNFHVFYRIVWLKKELPAQRHQKVVSGKREKIKETQKKMEIIYQKGRETINEEQANLDQILRGINLI